MLQVWQTPHRSRRGEGWLGVFNRHNALRAMYDLQPDCAGLAPGTQFRDVWTRAPLRHGPQSVPPGGVLCAHYA
jgi:hypothetical protein